MRMTGNNYVFDLVELSVKDLVQGALLMLGRS
jgi:hypothetical protein